MDERIKINRPKVSVIIPVYNTAPFLREAIGSITAQTLQEIQIIVINDGSTDNSLAIIEDLASHDKRIESDSHPNGGLSFTRNAGLRKAKGEYIYFMDSDDILEEDALSQCYTLCAEKQLDFVFFDAITFGNTQQLTIDYNRKGYIDEQMSSGAAHLNRLITIGKYTPSVCLCFINKAFMETNQLRFDNELRIHEDQEFTAKLFVSAMRVCYFPRSFFHRRVREFSLMTSQFSMKNMSAYLKIGAILTDYGKGKGADIQTLLHKLVLQMLDAATFSARILVFSERVYVANQLIKNGFFRISLKSWVVVLFPFSMKLRQIFKRNQ